MPRKYPKPTPGIPTRVYGEVHPQDVANLRADLARALKGAMPGFRDFVVHGKGAANWNMVRLKAFQIALARVVPEITQSKHEINITEKKIHELSIDDLEQIAASGIAAKKMEPSGWFEAKADAPVVDAEVIEAVAEPQPPTTNAAPQQQEQQP